MNYVSYNQYSGMVLRVVAEEGYFQTVSNVETNDDIPNCGVN